MKGVRRLKKYAGRLKRRLRPAGVILAYHRIASLRRDPLSLAVSADHFAEQLDYITRTCHPLKLLDLVSALEQRTVPRRAVAVTFDDGYGDNYRNAFPRLAAVRIPATIFITSGLIGSQRGFWWDELERILLDTADIPHKLELNIAGQDFKHCLASAADRRQAHAVLYQILKPLPPSERYRVLQGLSEWAAAPSAGHPDDRALTVAELIELSNSGLIEIGGHTQGHPQLSALPEVAQQTEIAGGKRRVEELIGRPIEAFAYPYGTAADFTETTAEAVRSTGFRAAVTTIHGYCESGDDAFRLRRCAVFDWELNTFKQKLEEFFVIRS
jgi:peptidoglycan/xylan/chitin deacetylase (PgdA/CDA1 family)